MHLIQLRWHCTIEGDNEIMEVILWSFYMLHQ